MHLKSCHFLSSVDGMTAQTTLTGTEEDRALLAAVTAAAHEAGDRLLEVYSPQARPASRQDLFAAGRRNEEISLAVLAPALAAARPGAQWAGGDQETMALPPGEWWSVDAVEGNVNHAHGGPQWCVSIALIRDGAPVLAVVRQPAGDLTYTAVRGGGAFVNAQPLHTSPKTRLDAAIAVTGQAEAGQDDTYRRIGDSITAMLGRALLVRAAVPSTFPLLDVAAGYAV
jgi:myo-inositol-1(or 4)-monophosphatase